MDTKKNINPPVSELKYIRMKNKVVYLLICLYYRG